jgi:tetratricopeptide (TPR) repeat protein
MDEVLAGNDAAARPLFEAALEDPDDSGRARAELDELAMRDARALLERDPAAAFAIYNELLVRDPENHRARMGAGRALEVQHQFDASIELLTASDACKRCAHQLGEVYELRGRQHMADANYEAATADYTKALEIEESAEALIDISEMFTVAHHGSAMGSAEALRRAHDLLTHQNTTLQELWAVERRDLALMAAAQHEFDAVTLALSIEDPRIALDAGGRLHALLDLKMDVAHAYQEHEEYERGLELGEAALKEAVAGLPAESMGAFKKGVTALHSRYALHLMAIGEARQAAVVLGGGLALEPGSTLLSYQAALAMSAIDQDSAEEMMRRIPESSEHWHRVHALVQTGRAQALLAEGKLQEAQTALTAAGLEYPDLLEVRLVRAEILARTPIPELDRKERKALDKHGVIAYPAGERMRYAEALAEVKWCRSRYEEEAAQLDPLRMPAFGARLATLEGDISAFYPYPVRKLPGMNPRIRITNSGVASVTLEVSGPGVEEELSLAPGANKTLSFDDPGVAQISFADKQWALVAEGRTLIDVAL